MSENTYAIVGDYDMTNELRFSPAQNSLKTLNDAILLTDKKTQDDIKYVEERLQFLLQRYGTAAIYALMRANLQVTVQAGN